jgi:sporadic carbohydrate cluster 2OG-Fe(II) oxygenase
MRMDRFHYTEKYESQGYVIFDYPNEYFQAVYNSFIQVISQSCDFVDDFSDLSTIFQDPCFFGEPINKIRKCVIDGLCRDPNFANLYFKIFNEPLIELLGPDIVQQRVPNFSIQIPHDESSVLSLHCDSMQGNSVFEVVGWLPLTDCWSTNSMFLLDISELDYQTQLLDEYITSGDADLYQSVKNKGKFIEIKKGQGLIFNQNLLHGNVVNTTSSTRISFNCRFKNLFSPYGEKDLLNFFEIVSTSPVSKLATRCDW